MEYHNMHTFNSIQICITSYTFSSTSHQVVTPIMSAPNVLWKRCQAGVSQHMIALAVSRHLQISLFYLLNVLRPSI